MVGGISFVALVGFGWLSLWAMKQTGPWGDFILERVGAVLMLAAGFVGAGGIVGQFLNWTTHGAMHLADLFGRQLVGASIVGLLGLVLGLLWIFAFLPKRFFKWGFPNWLIWGGIVLPSVVKAASGPAAEVVNAILSALGLGALSITSGLAG